MPRGRNFAITWNLERYTIDDVHELVDVLNSVFAKVRGYVIGAMEVGKENDYTHCHMLIVFKNPVSLSSVIEQSMNNHVELVVSYKKYLDYMKKDGPFIFNNLTGYSEDDVVFNDLVDCKNLTEFFRLHPNLINRFSQYEKMYFQIRADTIEDEEDVEL